MCPHNLVRPAHASQRVAQVGQPSDIAAIGPPAQIPVTQAAAMEFEFDQLIFGSPPPPSSQVSALRDACLEVVYDALVWWRWMDAMRAVADVRPALPVLTIQDDEEHLEQYQTSATAAALCDANTALRRFPDAHKVRHCFIGQTWHISGTFFEATWQRIWQQLISTPVLALPRKQNAWAK